MEVKIDKDALKRSGFLFAGNPDLGKPLGQELVVAAADFVD